MRTSNVVVAIVLVAAVAFSVGSLVLAKRVSDNTDQIKRQTATAQNAALGQCQRVQELRDDVNANSKVTYESLVLLADIVGEPSLVTQLDPKDKAARVAGVKELQKLSRQLVSIASTDCQEAVKHPLTYKAPPPVPFFNQ